MLACQLYLLPLRHLSRAQLFTLSHCVSRSLLYGLNNIATANFPLTDNCWTLPCQASSALASLFAKKGAAQAAVTNRCKLPAGVHANIHPGWFLLYIFVIFNQLKKQKWFLNLASLTVTWKICINRKHKEFTQVNRQTEICKSTARTHTDEKWNKRRRPMQQRGL